MAGEVVEITENADMRVRNHLAIARLATMVSARQEPLLGFLRG